MRNVLRGDAKTMHNSRIKRSFLSAVFVSLVPLLAYTARGDEPDVSPATATLLERAERIAANQDAQAAATLVRNGIATADDAPALRFALAKYLVESGRIKDAIAELNNALQEMPAFHRARLNLAQLHLQEGQYGNAAEHLVYLIDHGAADKSQLFTLLGAAHLQQNQAAAAESAYRQALLRRPGSRDARLGLIQALIQQDRLPAARALAREELRRTPESNDMWSLLAQAALVNNHRQDAIEALECARRLDVASADSLATLGDLYANQNMPQEALSVYERITDLQDAPHDRILRGLESFLALGHLSEAAALIARLENERGQLATQQQEKLLLLHADLCRQQGQTDCAIDHYRRVLENDPLNGRALLSLSDLYRQTDALSRAKTLLERAVRQDTFRAAALVRLAHIALAENDETQAVILLERSLDADNNAYVRDYLRRLRRILGRNE